MVPDNGDRHRCLTFLPISLSLFLPTLFRGAYTTSKTLSQVESEEARTTFAQVGAGLLRYLKPSFDLDIRLDKDVWRLLAKGVGKHPIVLRVRDGKVDMDEVLQWTQHPGRNLKKHERV